MAETSSTLPEQGQLVSVRSRQWVVTEVAPSATPAGRLQTGVNGRQNLLTLSSVEDDALGEDLSVIWEIEPGARVVEKVALPEPRGFDPPGELDAFLDAVRWGASSSADVRNIQAPFRSGIDIEDYQLDPVVRAIQMPRVNLLIADDVGLGKTIEAGMVALELMTRHRARRILVICPASLQVQWKEQMRDKFGLDFRIVDSALMREPNGGGARQPRSCGADDDGSSWRSRTAAPCSCGAERRRRRQFPLVRSRGTTTLSLSQTLRGTRPSSPPRRPVSTLQCAGSSLTHHVPLARLHPRPVHHPRRTRPRRHIGAAPAVGLLSRQ